MIPNTFSGFGSMTVRNTNMVTMSSFVVMIQCILHERRSGKKQEHDHLCNYEKYFKHCMDSEYIIIFNIFKDFCSGSIWEFYLLSVMILIAIFYNFYVN